VPVGPWPLLLPLAETEGPGADVDRVEFSRPTWRGEHRASVRISSSHDLSKCCWQRLDPSAPIWLVHSYSRPYERPALFYQCLFIDL